jgi:hypothetical protein
VGFPIKKARMKISVRAEIKKAGAMAGLLKGEW